MEEFKDLPLEVQLSAYLDGQLSDEEAQHVDDRLATDAHARELLNTLKAGSAFGNDLFNEMLKEPVPLHLVRAIKESAAKSEQQGAPARKPANGNIISFWRFMPQAIAASAVLLLAGGYSGYFIGKGAGQLPSEISDTSGWGAGTDAERAISFNQPQGTMRSLDPAISVVDIASVHDVYTLAADHLVEVPASDVTGLKKWIGQATGINFNVPDLSSQGMTFLGGRVVVLNGKPAGGLYFRNKDGGIVALYLVKGKVSVNELTEGTNAYYGANKGSVAWFIAAPGSISDVKPLADIISRSL